MISGTSSETILTFIVVGVMAFTVGYVLGHSRSSTERAFSLLQAQLLASDLARLDEARAALAIIIGGRG